MLGAKQLAAVSGEEKVEVNLWCLRGRINRHRRFPQMSDNQDQPPMHINHPYPGPRKKKVGCAPQAGDMHNRVRSFGSSPLH